MGLSSNIEWLRDPDGTLGATWNPLVGCTKVSPGCDNCYAEALVNRFAGHNKGFPNRFDVVTLRDDRMMMMPLSPKWQRQPLRVFVNSLSDLFHDKVPVRFIARVFAVMAHCPQHTFLMLTKRPGRMRSVLLSDEFREVYAYELGLLSGDLLRRRKITVDQVPTLGLWPLPNLWGGVSVESQPWAGIRIPPLLDCPFAVRWISLEPQLAAVELFGQPDTGCMNTGPAVTHHGHGMRVDYGTGTEWDCDHQVGIDWVVAGGESGPGARPMHPDWPQSVRDQCRRAGVAFSFKQWGNWAQVAAGEVRPTDHWVTPDGQHGQLRGVGGAAAVPDGAAIMRNVGKKAAGRQLDGELWDEYPAAAPATGTLA